MNDLLCGTATTTPFHRAPWSPPKQRTIAAAEYLSDIIVTRDNIGIIDTRDTTDVFHPVPFGGLLNALRIEKQRPTAIVHLVQHPFQHR